MERYLEKGYTLQRKGGRKYTITEMIGRGSSCAVYRAVDGKTEHLLKEYNPRMLSITRKGDGMMCVSADEQESFCAGLAHFRAGYEKQLDLRQTDELRNSTSNIQDIFDANGTRYIDMTLFTGSIYTDIREKSLYDLCKRMKAVAQVVGNYHKAGLLHLDIKPDNIFAIPETCELVMLFDFDSVVEKNDIQKSAGLSYTKMWAAPEQAVAAYRRKICEATDLYAIGEMVFWQIFGRHSTSEEHRSFFEYQFDIESEIFKNINPKVFPLLSELLHRTITTSVSNRYQSADELIAVLDELIKLSDPKEPYLVSTNVTAEEFFIGRDNELKTMHEMLSEKNILFLCGMGGIGKSELARNFVKQYRGDYDTVFFATYMSSWSMLLTDDYAIQIANFHPYEGEKPEDYCARKLRKLKELCDERTLFVIDNVNEDEYDEQEECCYRDIMGLPCRFLLTSRLHEWNHPMMEVGELAERSDLVALFDKWCRIKNEEQMNAVDEIIDYVDAHTLTLELIAKQTTAGFSTPAKMLSKLKEHGMRDSGKEKVKSDKDLAVSKKTAFEHICALFDLAALTDDEKYVMANMALIPSTGIEARLFMDWCELEDADDIHSLVAKGWIDRDDERISLHPIVAEVSLNYHYDFELGDTVMLKNATDYLINGFESFLATQKEQYAVFSGEISNKIVRKGIFTELAADFLEKVSYQYSKYVSISSLILRFTMALRIANQCFPEKLETIARLECYLGEMYDAQDSLQEAERLYFDSLEKYTQLFGPDDCKLADVFFNLGVLYDNMCNYSEAKKFLTKSLELSSCQFGKKSSAVADVYCELGQIYCDEGDYKTAKEYQFHALKIWKELYSETGKKSIMYDNIARVYDCLGAICFCEDNYEDSISYCKKTLDIRESLLGSVHYETINSYHNLGAILRESGLFSEAESYLKKALQEFKRIYGDESSHTATSLDSLGQLFFKMGEYEEALCYFQQSLFVRQKLFGEEHMETACSYWQLSAVFYKLSNIQKAKEYLNKSYFIFCDRLGNENPRTIEISKKIQELSDSAQ